MIKLQNILKEIQISPVSPDKVMDLIWLDLDYHSHNEEKWHKIIDLILELGYLKIFKETEELSYERVYEWLETLDPKILNQIYIRAKKIISNDLNEISIEKPYMITDKGKNLLKTLNTFYKCCSILGIAELQNELDPLNTDTEYGIATILEEIINHNKGIITKKEYIDLYFNPNKIGMFDEEDDEATKEDLLNGLDYLVEQGYLK